jgi:hypothetical protein
MRSSAPSREAGVPAVRRTLCARSAPPWPPGAVFAVPAGLGGSPQGLAGVTMGDFVPPHWPKSWPVAPPVLAKLAPSPAVA